MFICFWQKLDIAGAIIPLFDKPRSEIANDRTDKAIAYPMGTLGYPAYCRK
jgi:hypothetical protein